jgi:pimeloyl-ACP methyl ester carboxylesterase
VTLDLPGHGGDPTPLENITLADYVEAVLRVVRVQSRPPIVVGHSIGGPIGGLAAESEPQLIAALVFVAGLLPPTGQPLAEALAGFDPAYLAETVWASDRRSAKISPQGVRKFACSGCSDEIVAEVVRRMTMEPMAPYEVPVVTSETRFGRTPRWYVETLRDRIVPLQMQRVIQSRGRFTGVVSLDTDHFPLLSAPGDLVACLDEIASGL